MSNELVKRETPANVLEVLQHAIEAKPDIAVLRGLFELQKDFMKMQAEQTFNSAMARLQAEIPQVNKYGQGKNNKYAKLEDIDVIIRPLLAKFGFSFSFDEESHTDKTVTFLAKISHEDGHSEIKRLTVPVDAAASNSMGKSIRPAIQDAGSTVSYARRYLIKMHLNLIETDEDTDGESRKKIGDDQAKDIEAMLQDFGAESKSGFLRYMGVESVSDILEVDLKKAIESINAKRRSMGK